MNRLLRVPQVGIRSLHVWRRNAEVWRHGAIWSNLMGDLFEPIIYLFGLGFGLGAFVEDINGTSYIQYIAPGLLAMGVMWGSSFECTYAAFTRMDRQKTYQAIMVTPVNIEEVIAGDILWGATKSTISAAMVLLVATVMGLATYPTALLTLPVAFVAGITFSAMALTATALAPNYDFFTYYFTILLTPLLLISEAWYPVSGLPHVVQVAADLSPLTHAVRPVRAFMTGEPDRHVLASLMVLLGYAILFAFLSMNLVRRRLVQ